jgi:hypothetical protein
VFKAAERAAVAHKPFADDEHSGRMHDCVKFLRIVAGFCAQCTVEPVGQILDRDFVGQRGVVADAERIDFQAGFPLVSLSR